MSVPHQTRPRTEDAEAVAHLPWIGEASEPSRAVISVASQPCSYVKNANHFPRDWQPQSNSEPNLPKYLLCKQIKQRSILKMRSLPLTLGGLHVCLPAKSVSASRVHLRMVEGGRGHQPGTWLCPPRGQRTQNSLEGAFQGNRAQAMPWALCRGLARVLVLGSLLTSSEVIWVPSLGMKLPSPAARRDLSQPLVSPVCTTSDVMA